MDQKIIQILLKIIKYVAIGFILIAISSIAISIFSVAREVTRIPREAIIGLEPKSYKILGSFKLSDWSRSASDQEYITIFQGKLGGTNQTELRAYYDDGTNTKYVGQLDTHLGLLSVKTIFIDINGEKSIVGWVSPEIEGKLLTVRFERPELDKRLKSYAVKESTLEKNLFIVPISVIENNIPKTYGWLGDDNSGENPKLWNEINMIAIQTKESLKRGFDGNESYYEVEKSFIPPVNVSNLYKEVFTNENE